MTAVLGMKQRRQNGASNRREDTHWEAHISIEAQIIGMHLKIKRYYFEMMSFLEQIRKICPSNIRIFRVKRAFRTARNLIDETQHIFVCHGSGSWVLEHHLTQNTLQSGLLDLRLVAYNVSKESV
jgi:hypothetical protein